MQFTLEPSRTILLIVDVQEKIFAYMDRGQDVLHTLCKVVKGFQILNLPILLSEQYPQGLGPTVSILQNILGDAYHPWIKRSFSCLEDDQFFDHFISLPYQQWIVVGIEAHICVLQTVKGMLKAGKQVAILNDAITSRSIDNFSTAVAEMRDAGARITCSETILFELLKDSKHPQFKSILKIL